MSEIIEYFVRHYSLVINNDQESYNEATQRVREVTRSSDLTVSQYRNMTDGERRTALAMNVGERILDMVRDACESVTDKHSGTLGALLIAEAMNYSGGDLTWALGADFLPEDNEADDFFADDETDPDE